MRNETERPPAASSEEFSNLASAVLAARLPAASPWMPRREMEELARRGPAVLPVLADVLRMAPGRGDPLWPIVVLGELRDAGAVPVLGVFLGRVEGGLAVAAAAVHAPSRMRRELEAAIAALVQGPIPPDPVERDWRLRYRRLPALGWNFPLTWLGVAALVHRSGLRARARASRGPVPLTLFDAITDIAARREGRPCRRCGSTFWRPAGIRVCRHPAEAMVELQAARLDRWLAAGIGAVLAALDACH